MKPLFERFLEEEPEDILLQLCYFSTGRRGVSATSKIIVTIDESSDAFSASTCDEGLVIPGGIKGDYDNFSSYLKCVIAGTCKFNTI